MPDQTIETQPKIVTSIDWKNFFIALFLGTSFIGFGVAAYYNLELAKLVPPLPLKIPIIASPSATPATPSDQMGESSVTLSELLKSPKKYSNQKICTEGVYYDDFETSVLVESFDEEKVFDTQEAIWVKNETEKDILVVVSEKKAVQEIKTCGVFQTGGGFGHLGAYKHRLNLESLTTLGETKYFSQ